MHCSCETSIANACDVCSSRRRVVWTAQTFTITWACFIHSSRTCYAVVAVCALPPGVTNTGCSAGATSRRGGVHWAIHAQNMQFRAIYTRTHVLILVRKTPAIRKGLRSRPRCRETNINIPRITCRETNQKNRIILVCIKYRVGFQYQIPIRL